MEVVAGHSFLETSLSFVLISEINDQGFQTMPAHSENTDNVLCTCASSIIDNA